MERFTRLELRLMLACALCLVFASFCAGYAYSLHQSRKSVVLIEHVQGKETIELVRYGEVVGEWEPRDGEVYDVLDEALHEN